IPAKGISVGLELEGRVVEKDSVLVEVIDPGQEVPVTLTGSLDEAGPKGLTVRVSGDGLPGDNRFDKIVLIRDQLRILVVDGTPDYDMPAEAGSHFVRNALTRVPPNQTESYYIRPEVVTVSEATPAALAGKDLCYLLNAPLSTDEHPTGLSPAFLARLNEFVRAGGGLVIGCGDLVRADE